MTQKRQVTTVSDISGAEGAETVRFSLDGVDYEIDLSGPEAEILRTDLAPWVARSRKRKPPRPQKGRARSARRADLPEIREYAKARGYGVGTRGQVPKNIVKEYDLLRASSSAGA